MFPNGVLWASLGDPPPLVHLTRWKPLLGADLDSGQDQIQNLRDQIGKRRILIVLDDVWQTEDLTELLQVGGPRCGYLITTRFLRMAASVSRGQILAVQELTLNESLALFHTLVPLAATQVDESALRLLVAAAGGLPLALTLMGHQVRTVAQTESPRRLMETLVRLRDLGHLFTLHLPFQAPGSSMPVSLRAAFDRGPVFIRGSRLTPPQAREVPEYIQQWVNWVNGEEGKQYQPILRAAIAHHKRCN